MIATNLLAHDADYGSLYKIIVKKNELIKSMSPEDIDGVILGTLQNKIEYSVKLMGVMDLGQGVGHFDN